MKCRNIKKLWSIPVVYALVLVLLAGCVEKPAVPTHTHTADGGMQSDAETHWKVCECGEIFDQEAHTLENGVCTVCGTVLQMLEDGASQTELYNEYGDLTKMTVTDTDGVVLIDESYEYEYDADGRILSKKCYDGGRLTSNLVFSLDENGEVYTAEETTWDADGSMRYNEYDMSGNTTHAVNYYADGSVEAEWLYEYSPDEDRMFEKEYRGSVLKGEYEFILGENGERTLARSCIYEEDGSYMLVEYDDHRNETYEGSFDAEGKAEWEYRHENEYDAEGNLVRTLDYRDGALFRISEFVFGEDKNGLEWSMSGKITQYDADGTVTVNEYDPDGAWATEVEYDAAGNELVNYRYEYDYDEGGILVGSRLYKDGSLSEESAFTVDAQGVTESVQVTKYFADGGKIASQYDGSWNLISETLFDAKGNVIGEA